MSYIKDLLSSSYTYLKNLVVGFATIGCSNQESDASNRITVFTNLMVAVSIQSGFALCILTPLVGMPLLSLIPIMIFMVTSTSVVFCNYYGKRFHARVLAIFFTSLVGWHTEFMFGKSWNGDYMFFVVVLYSVVGFSREALKIRLAVIAIAITNFLLADILFHSGFESISGLDTRDFPIPLLWVNTGLYVALITVVMWVEKTRADRHEEGLNQALETISQEKQKIQIVFDSINQGIFVVDSKLKVEPEFSAGAKTLFPNSEISGEDIIDLLFSNSLLNEDKKSSIKNSMEFCIGEDIVNWEINQSQFPDQVKMKGDKVFSLSWSPLVKGDIVLKIVLSIEDVTQKLLMEAEEKRKKKIDEHSQVVFTMIAKVGVGFCQDFLESLLKVSSDLKSYDSSNAIPVKRDLHTLKGESRLLGIENWSKKIHDVEDALTGLKDGNSLNEISDLLSAFVEECEEFCSTGQKLIQKLSGGAEETWNLYSYIYNLKNKINQQLDSSNIFLESISFHDGVKNWPKEYQKSLQNILLHSLQNAVDHGYLLAGLNENVNLRVRTIETDSEYKIYIEDYGNGLNMPAIDEKFNALSPQVRGLLSQPSDILFMEDFTTAKTISQTSGRGVGLSALKHEVDRHFGEISISNCQDHRGAKISILLPKKSATQAIAS